MDFIATQSKSSDQIITGPKGFHSLIVAYLAERHNVSRKKDTKNLNNESLGSLYFTH